MCGIFGYFSRREAPLERKLVEQMGMLLEHRGSDDLGIRFGDSAALANQCLSIIDVVSGHKPFVSDDGNIVVNQYGEIFNYVELVEEVESKGHQHRIASDAEIVLRLDKSRETDLLLSAAIHWHPHAGLRTQACPEVLIIEPIRRSTECAA